MKESFCIFGRDKNYNYNLFTLGCSRRMHLNRKHEFSTKITMANPKEIILNSKNGLNARYVPLEKQNNYLLPVIVRVNDIYLFLSKFNMAQKMSYGIDMKQETYDGWL